jgi:Flp pilus assembly pilin Flp
MARKRESPVAEHKAFLMQLVNRGQSLAEYTLLLGFVALVFACLLVFVSDGMEKIWKQSEKSLRDGNSSVEKNHGEH